MSLSDTWRALHATVAGCALIGLMAGAVAQSTASPLDIRTFRQASSVWMVSPQGITVYDYGARGVRGVILDETTAKDSIADVAEYEGTLWISARSGLYQADMATGTIERLPSRADSVSLGRLAIDYDYLWFAGNDAWRSGRADTLWRFDKLAREWFGYPFENSQWALARVVGLAADGDNVQVMVFRQDASANNRKPGDLRASPLPQNTNALSVEVFAVADEKWRSFALAGELLADQRHFRAAGTSLLLASAGDLLKFSTADLAWERIKAGDRIDDLVIADSIVYALCGSGAISINLGSSIVRRLDVNGLEGAVSLARLSDTLFIATPRAIVRYDIAAGTTDMLEHPASSVAPAPVAAIGLDSMVLIRHQSGLNLYRCSSGQWESSDLPRAGGRRTLSWNDDGLRVRYAPASSSTLRGSIGWRLSMVDNVLMLKDTARPGRMAIPEQTNLTLHTTFGPERYLDLFYDDVKADQVPSKGARYSGATDDWVRSARAGTVDFTSMHGIALPDVRLEGGSIELQSRAKLADRDRRVIRSTAGGGLVLTQTRSAVLGFRELGDYTLPGFSSARSDTSMLDSTEQSRDTTIIVPGSVRVRIDGETLDSALYTVAYGIGSVQFDRLVVIDPTSVVTVEYQVRAIPDKGVHTTEIVPSNSFGQIAFANVAVSPVSWVSPALGYTYLWNKSGARHDIGSASVPIELRGANAMLKFDPQFSIDMSDSAHAKAGGVAMSARLGKRFSAQLNGMLADSAFVSSDVLSRGYGARTAEIDYRLSYDIIPEIPVSFYEHNRVASDGREDRYELSAGVRFPKYPHLDMSLSRNAIDARFESARVDSLGGGLTAFDTLATTKDKLRVRLYETSSELLQRLTHCRRIGYDVSWTEFRADTDDGDEWLRGRVVYGRGTIFPVDAVVISMTGLYRANPEGSRTSRDIEPRITVQTTDLPRGIDLIARYGVDFGRIADADSSEASVSRGAEIVVKPGQWSSALRWVTLRGGIGQSVTCAYDETDPRWGEVLLGSGGAGNDVITSTAGVSIYPVSKVLFQSTNQWVSADSAGSYSTTNDIKLWLGKRALWQTRWRYETGDVVADRHTAFSRYEKSWNGWLKTRQGIAGTYQRAPGFHVVEAGPDLDIEVDAKDVLWVFKNIQTRHGLRLRWSRTNGEYEWNPDLSYTAYLRAVIKPNIAYEFTGSLKLLDGVYDRFEAVMWLRFIF